MEYYKAPSLAKEVFHLGPEWLINYFDCQQQGFRPQSTHYSKSQSSYSNTDLFLLNDFFIKNNSIQHILIWCNNLMCAILPTAFWKSKYTINNWFILFCWLQSQNIHRFVKKNSLWCYSFLWCWSRGKYLYWTSNRNNSLDFFKSKLGSSLIGNKRERNETATIHKALVFSSKVGAV